MPAVASCDRSPHSAANSTPKEIAAAFRNDGCARGLGEVLVLRAAARAAPEDHRADQEERRHHAGDQGLGQQGEQRAGSDRDGDLEAERRPDADEHRQRREPGGQHQGGEQRLVRELHRQHQDEGGGDDRQDHDGHSSARQLPNRWAVLLPQRLAGRNAVRDGRPGGLASRHAVPLTHPAAPGPPPRPTGRGLGRAVRAGALLPALRAAVPRHRPLRRADLRAVRRLVGHRLRHRGARPARSPTGGPAAASSSWRACCRPPAFVGLDGGARRVGLRRRVRHLGRRRARWSPARARRWSTTGSPRSAAGDSYARVNGWMTSAELLVQVPTAFAASALFALGGYPLVGWASVAVCLAAAALALRFPEAPRTADGERGGTAAPGGGRGAARPGAAACSCSPSR